MSTVLGLHRELANQSTSFAIPITHGQVFPKYNDGSLHFKVEIALIVTKGEVSPSPYDYIYIHPLHL